MWAEESYITLKEFLWDNDQLSRGAVGAGEFVRTILRAWRWRGPPEGETCLFFFTEGFAIPISTRGDPPGTWLIEGCGTRSVWRGDPPTPQESRLLDLGHKNIKASSFWNVLFLMFLKILERYFKVTKTFLTTFKGYKEKVFFRMFNLKIIMRTFWECWKYSLNDHSIG